MIFALGIAMSHGCVVQALHTLVVFTADGSLNISRSQEFTVYILTKEIPTLNAPYWKVIVFCMSRG